MLRTSGGRLLLAGAGAGPEGDRPFLDLFDPATGGAERVFQSRADEYAVVAAVVSDDASRLVVRRESQAEPPNYYLRDQGRETKFTDNHDPAPFLRGVKKQLVTTQRPDGVGITFTLYLPPGRKDGERLPTVFWAYPKEFNSADTAGQVSGSAQRFTSPVGVSHLFFLTQGYAVMDEVGMPVVGPPESANDTFVEQIVASAKAAIDRAVEMGAVDRERIGIGGHSYGAFMAANLLAHSDLFRAGIARSGAYNRTLTPFGFQNERRTFWEAADVYARMSPFHNAHKIDEPILLIHGAADDNPGTFPLQSERLFQAIRGNGGTARLVVLPHESHGYSARESIGHVLAEQIDWFDKYVKNAGPRGSKSNDSDALTAALRASCHTARLSLGTSPDCSAIHATQFAQFRVSPGERWPQGRAAAAPVRRGRFPGTPSSRSAASTAAPAALRPRAGVPISSSRARGVSGNCWPSSCQRNPFRTPPPLSRSRRGAVAAGSQRRTPSPTHHAARWLAVQRRSGRPASRPRAQSKEALAKEWPKRSGPTARGGFRPKNGCSTHRASKASMQQPCTARLPPASMRSRPRVPCAISASSKSLHGPASKPWASEIRCRAGRKADDRRDGAEVDEDSLLDRVAVQQEIRGCGNGVARPAANAVPAPKPVGDRQPRPVRDVVRNLRPRRAWRSLVSGFEKADGEQLPVAAVGPGRRGPDGLGRRLGDEGGQLGTGRPRLGGGVERHSQEVAGRDGEGHAGGPLHLRIEGEADALEPHGRHVDPFVAGADRQADDRAGWRHGPKVAMGHISPI